VTEALVTRWRTARNRQLAAAGVAVVSSWVWPPGPWEWPWSVEGVAAVELSLLSPEEPLPEALLLLESEPDDELRESVL
jgi:hypothetical protein